MLTYVMLRGMEIFQWARVVNLNLVGVDHDGRHVTVLGKQPATMSLETTQLHGNYRVLLPVPHHGAVQAPAGVEDHLDGRAQPGQH